jgi:hypothetical protein
VKTRGKPPAMKQKSKQDLHDEIEQLRGVALQLYRSLEMLKNDSPIKSDAEITNKCITEAKNAFVQYIMEKV